MIKHTSSERLGKSCTACGVTRNKKSILYDPNTLLPYCESPWICPSEEHVNSPKNIILRGGDIKLIGLEQAQKAYREILIDTVQDSDQVKKIRSMVERPISIRIGSPDMAQFLVALQDEQNFSSISDAVRYCVQMVMNHNEEYFNQYKEMQTQIQKERYDQEVAKELEKKTQQPKQVEPTPEPVKGSPAPEPAADDEELVF
jgi:Arc/MetJ-type ribon-helix-helix transcriptional regulator